ncbi:MAG: carboxypeptidase-like regulatory domain-containing protein [Ignavibacteriae bacterium]|nr:carboxypeptidase-like regulatory domain-containing protein [Ignavibacteriota bacterium]
MIFFIFLFNSCNALHNNLLDPENPNNNVSTIEGFVKTINVPQEPIENAKVFWENSGIITQTNSQGYFRILNIERENGWLTIEKEGFSIDSIYVEFDSQKKISKNIFLNKIPIIEDLQFYSITINRFPSNQIYKLGIDIKINDEENDIDSVFIENSELSVKKELLYNASTKYYENILELVDLHVSSIDIVIGKEFNLNVLDSESKKFEIAKTNIKRIIKEVIETTSPSGRDTVQSSSPLFEWRRFSPGFEYKYLLEIYTDEVSPILVWQKEINSTEIQHQSNANLNSGDYFWVIWAIDEFQNRTRSKPSSFIIK